MHNLCCDNCHSHVARALNLMQYDGSTRFSFHEMFGRECNVDSISAGTWWPCAPWCWSMGGMWAGWGCWGPGFPPSSSSPSSSPLSSSPTPPWRRCRKICSSLLKLSRAIYVPSNHWSLMTASVNCFALTIFESKKTCCVFKNWNIFKLLLYEHVNFVLLLISRRSLCIVWSENNLN